MLEERMMASFQEFFECQPTSMVETMSFVGREARSIHVSMLIRGQANGYLPVRDWVRPGTLPDMEEFKAATTSE